MQILTDMLVQNDHNTFRAAEETGFIARETNGLRGKLSTTLRDVLSHRALYC